jgi:hypothetical protein
MPVANHALAPVRKNKIGTRGKKRVELDLHRSRNQPTGAGSKDFSERIIDRVFLSESKDSILVHGVTLLLGGSGGLVTNPVTPPSSPRHPVSPIAHRHVVTALRPHHAAAAGNREGPIETRQRESREIAGNGFNGEMEVAAIGFLSRPLPERQVGFTLLKRGN